MTGIFGRKNPSNIILLFLYGLALRIPYYNQPLQPVEGRSDGALYHELLQILKPMGQQVPALYAWLAYLLIFSQALSLNAMVNKLRLMARPNFLPAMSFLLITAFFSAWNQLSSAMLVNTLLLGIWSALNRLQQGEKSRAILFNAGFALGLGNLFYSYAFTFGLVIYAALLLYRSFRLNEYLLPILGYLTPYYFILAWRYWTGNWAWRDYLLHIGFRLPDLQNRQWMPAGMLLILLMGVGGLYFVQQQSGKMLIQARKSWTLLLFYLLISLLIPFVNADLSYWILCLLPMAAFIACLFLYPRNRWFKNILHWLVVGFSITAALVLTGQL